MRLMSWNVNGIRSAMGKGFPEFVAAHAPDILCLQEVRATPDQVDLDHDGYQVHWHPATVRKGYSGVAVMTRIPPLSVSRGLGRDGFSGEGRVLTLEFEPFHLVNVYTPNARRDLSRLDYRQSWDRAFLECVSGLDASKPVVFCGDLNVSHKEIDLANPASNRRNAGFTPQERDGFSAYVRAGFIDTFREFESGGGHYSWWSYRLNARQRNIGWRLDYFLVSSRLRPFLQDARIHPDVLGSDHCPVSIDISGP